MRRRSTPSARRSAVARCIERESARETQVLCEQPSRRGGATRVLPLSLYGLLAQAWSVRGTPSRGGPGGSSLAGLRGRAEGTGRSGVADSRVHGKHGEFAQGMYMCEISSLVFTGNVYVFTQRYLLRCVSRKGGESGWTRGVVPLPPRDGALPSLVSAQQRSIARCLGVRTQGGIASGNGDQALCHRVPGNDKTLCLRGSGGP